VLNGTPLSAKQTALEAIHPRSHLAIALAVMSGMCLVYTVIYGPFTLAFYWFADVCDGTPVDAIDMTVEVIFLVEIAWSFFIGRYVGIKYLGTVKEVVADYATSGQLPFDLFTSIPVAWIEFAQRRSMCDFDSSSEQKGSVSLLRMVKLVKPLRLLRLLRMLKMFNSRALKALKDSIVVEPDQMRLVKIGMGVLISCHFAGCLFWLVKSLSNEDSPDNLNHFLMEQVS
jgi:hypothetical protein